MTLRHLILDRDGVLNRENPHGGWIATPADWQWETGALDGLRAAAEAGLRISITTNQSGIGRGELRAEDVAAVHDRMRREAERAGARIDAIFVCPHAPGDGCDCRKPAPGLIRSALQATGVPASESVVIGDAMRDLEAAASAGVAAVLVRTGKGAATERELGGSTVQVFDDLERAVRGLLAKE